MQKLYLPMITLISSVLISSSVCAWSDNNVQYCFSTVYFSFYLEEIS